MGDGTVRVVRYARGGGRHTTRKAIDAADMNAAQHTTHTDAHKRQADRRKPKRKEKNKNTNQHAPHATHEASPAKKTATHLRLKCFMRKWYPSV